MRWVELGPMLVAATVSMTMAEFIEFQKLSADSLRTRFGLSTSCEPAVTALATDPAMDRVNVAIDCRSTPGGTPPAIAPGQPPRPVTPGKKAS